jgi:hypothetical protein
MYTVKNLTYQPILLFVDDKTFLVQKRKSVEVPRITAQIINLTKRNFTRVR